MRRLNGSARAATGMLVVLALGWASVAPVQAAPSATPSLDPPTLVAPRLAFTDDSDELVVRRTDTYCPSGPCAGTEVLSGGDHTGEASATRYTPPQEGESDSQPRDAITYVSSTDDMEGEVYLSDVDGPAGEVVRVTCNTSGETHPVLSPDGGKVAYASKDPSGAWQISVAWLRSADGAQPLACADMPRVQLTTQGSNTWPTWLGSDQIVFSSSRTDPLGDLYAVRLGERPDSVDEGEAVDEGGAVDADAVRLTFSGAAETQPAAMTTGDTVLIVFTTTQFRHDGSLGGIRMRRDSGGGLTPGEVHSLWSSPPPQSSEAAFDTRAPASVGNPYATGLAFGYSTRDTDPFGDVVTTVMTPTPGPGPPSTGEPTTTPPSGGPTDPTTDPTTEEPSVGLKAVDPSIDFGYEADAGRTESVSSEPGRSESHVVLAHGDGTDVAAFTRRAHSADVSDVVATEGSARRVVASESLDLGEGDVRERDESAPAYSPDGSRIAYSRTTSDGREIVTAAADGTEPRALLKERPLGAADLEPAWSPDGTRVAFVRATTEDGESSGPTEVWVATVASGVARKVTLDVSDRRFWDESPSWSPDSTRLVVSRAVEVLKPDLVVSLAAPDTVTTGDPFLVTSTVTNNGPGSTGSDDAVVRLVPSRTTEAPQDDFSFEPTGGPCLVSSTGVAECNLGPLRAGESVTVSVPAVGVHATTGTIDAYVVPIDEVRTDNNTASVSVVVKDPPDVSVALALPTAMDDGSSADARLAVTNVGGTTAGAMTVTATAAVSTNAAPGAVVFTDVPSGCTLVSRTTVTCRVDSLAPGEARAWNLTVRAVSVGLARLSASVPRVPGETNSDNNTASASVVVRDPPDVSVALALPTAMDDGSSGNARLTVTNVGGTPTLATTVRAAAAVSTAAAPGAVVFTDAPSGCTLRSPTAVTCTVDSLASRETSIWNLTVRADSVGVARVSAAVPLLPGETNSDNNNASASTRVNSVINVSRSLPRTSLLVASVEPAVVRALPAAPPPSVRQELWVLDVATGAGAVIVGESNCPPTRVCDPSPVEGRVPAWSPDGMRIAYELRGTVAVLGLSDPDGNGVADRPERAATAILVTGLRADGTATESRATISSATDPAWSPDGTELAISGQPAGLPDNGGIYAVRPDGTGLRPIAQDRGAETEPAWQPMADIGVALVAVPAAGDTGFATVVTATVTNAGPTPARALRMLLEVPPGVDHGEPPPGCTFTDRVLTCDVALLVPGGSTTFAVPATVVTEGGHAVTATVSTPVPDPRPTNNTAAVLVTASTVLADLGVTLSASPADGLVGFDSVLDARVTNNGPRQVLFATVRIVLPPGLTGGSAPFGCSLSGPVLTCGLASMNPGSTQTRLWPVRAAGVGAHVVSAEVSSSVPDPVTTNNVAQASVTVREALADLAVSVATTTPGFVGGAGTTTVTVTNHGPQPVSGATLTLVHPAPAIVAVTAPQPCLTNGSPCAVEALAMGASVVFTVKTTFRDAGTGGVIASVSSSLRDPAPADNRAVAPLVVKQPVLRLSPDVVAPGGVTVVTGRDFPPGTAVTFGWDVGIVERRGPAPVRADGTLGAVQVVIMRRDRLGVRTLTATGSVAGQFTPVRAQVLVAPRNLTPPSFVERN